MRLIVSDDLLGIVLILMASVGIIIKLAAWIGYKRLEVATDNMSQARTTFTKRLKLKFENCYKLNLDIKNIPAFVEKYIRGYKPFGISLYYFRKILQIMAICVAIVALGGAFYQYTKGMDMREIYRIIMIGILGELLILLCEVVFDTKGVMERITVNLEEYLENVFSNRLHLEYDDSKLKPVVPAEEAYQMGDFHTAASKVRMKRSRKPENVVNEEETVIREIIKEFLC